VILVTGIKLAMQAWAGKEAVTDRWNVQFRDDDLIHIDAST
jgi:hypothetical protein